MVFDVTTVIFLRYCYCTLNRLWHNINITFIEFGETRKTLVTALFQRSPCHSGLELNLQGLWALPVRSLLPFRTHCWGFLYPPYPCVKVQRLPPLWSLADHPGILTAHFSHETYHTGIQTATGLFVFPCELSENRDFVKFLVTLYLPAPGLQQECSKCGEEICPL